LLSNKFTLSIIVNFDILVITIHQSFVIT